MGFRSRNVERNEWMGHEIEKGTGANLSFVSPGDFLIGEPYTSYFRIRKEAAWVLDARLEEMHVRRQQPMRDA